MPFNRPTLEELVNRIVPDIAQKVTGTSTPLRRAVIRVLAIVYAGIVNLIYGFLDWVVLQIFLTTADEENKRRWCSIYGVEPTEATYAVGLVEFTTTGATVAAGAILVRADGVEYTADSDGTVVGSVVTVAATCSAAGEDGNADPGTELTLATPVAGVDSTGEVGDDGLVDGTEEESIDSLVARTLKKIQDPPQGGAETDYEQWALEVSGVTRAWVFPKWLGAGTVGVTFVRDGDTPITPTVPQVAEMQDHIDEKRPVTADVTVFASTLVPRDFTIALDPDTTARRAAVQAELKDLFLRKAKPGGTILLSHQRAAVAAGADDADSEVVSPVVDTVDTAGHLSTLGTITWA